MQTLPTINLSKPQYDIATSRKQINLFLAGQGSGKTFLMGFISYLFVSNFPQTRGLICANTYQQLTRSTLFRIREVWKIYYGVMEYDENTQNGHYIVGKKPPSHFDTISHNFDNYGNIISFINGAVIYVGSLDNFKSLDGMEIAWELLDETKDTREEAVKEVLTGRLRQKGIYINLNQELTNEENDANIPFMPMYIFTSPAKVPWLNDWFSLSDFEPEIRASIYGENSYFKKSVGNKFVTVSSTFLNKKNLPENYIQNQIQNLPSYLQDMLIYGNPFGKTGGEFVKTFSRQMHVQNVAGKYQADLNLHLSFDFNAKPYMTCLAFQCQENKVFLLKEICLASPQNTTPAMADAILKIFGQHKGKLLLYGDASGHQQGHRREDGKNDYQILESILKTKFTIEKKVPQANPSVSLSGGFLNVILEKNIGNIFFMIDVSCQKMISDLEYCKEASDGTMLKEQIKDKETGVSYEPYGHCLDALRYFMTMCFTKEYKKFQGKNPENDIVVLERPQNNHVF